ncbi:hypothetical protein BD626DRAFT_485366 [Schizophyllum amplum]|uniref:Uncharacterized protein n=1 Tax=Schizophyllum amplum TaxID=97359 RepID=A0A550CR51_9AGAR|nr:hypothetical protein BD626DRAFT_485366 [Auriculariopsis ampla]
MSPGAPVPSSSISPPRTSAKKRANAKIHSFSTSAGLVKYIYVGKPANNGRNVLQRVEDLIADPYIKSFGPHDVVCAGCDYPFATSNGSANAGIYKYSTGGWRKHQCNRLLDWKDPFSPRKLTPEMAAEFAHSRMVSRDRALAHLVEVDQIERVYY